MLSYVRGCFEAACADSMSSKFYGVLSAHFVQRDCAIQGLWGSETDAGTGLGRVACGPAIQST